MSGTTWARLREGTGWVSAAVAVVCCLAAFAGLSVSGWWTDELFTLFLIDHDGGSGEVLRRALTDTQPPLYYLALHTWSRLSGVGEVGCGASAPGWRSPPWRCSRP